MAESDDAVTVRVRWRTAVHEVTLPASAPLAHLAQRLADATGIAPDTARVVVSGKMVALGLASGRPPLILLGQTAAEAQSVVMEASAAQAAALRLREPSAEHEARVAWQRATGAPQQKEPSPPSGEWTFGAFTTLQGPLLPSSRHALLLLYKVASDPGIVAVMKAHRWRVGLLSEMPPEGKVGVSAMCVLGYNVNQGQEIALRLRTDDMKGFRRYERIRETLVHELAHMVYGEHDLRFKALNSQLTREAAAANPDWSRPTVGRTLLGGDAHSSWAAGEDSGQQKAAASHVLGGASAGPVSPRTAAAEAAAQRERARLGAHAEADMAAEARDALGAAAQDPSGCGAGSDGDSGGTEVGEARA